jgi:hypothetical protein
MKTTDIIIKKILLISVFTVLFFYNSSPAHAEVSHLGDFCVYQNTPGLLGQPPVFLMELGVLAYGTNHFVLNGSGAFGLDEPISGTGDINGNTFVATLIYTLVNSVNTSFTVSHLVLNFPPVGVPVDAFASGTLTEMTFDLTQPTAQNSVRSRSIYATVCSP